MEKLCDALDQTVLDIFQILMVLHDAKFKLEETLKDGYFQMSRARYNIGVKRINADQIVDADISCSRSVSLLENAEEILNCGGKDNSELDCQVKLFSLECRKKVNKETKKELEDKDEVKTDGNTELRQRGQKALHEKKSKETTSQASGASEKSSSDEKIEEDDSKKNKFVLTDPINLFGVLVPQSLRSSQKSFETAVALSVDIVNLQSQLSLLQKRYSSLRDRKKNLISEKES